MAGVRLDLTFPHQYEVVLIEESNSRVSGIKHYTYSVNPERGERDGLLVKVSPHEGSPWVGLFEVGAVSPGAINGVFSMPDSSSICIVSSGEGYLVRIDHPTNWEEIRCHPIWDVRLIPEKKLILFADYSHIVAYGPKGLAWRSDRLSWEGLQIRQVTPEVVRGSGQSTDGEEIEFAIDVDNGKLINTA